jgi:hypothetical protein
MQILKNSRIFASALPEYVYLHQYRSEMINVQHCNHFGNVYSMVFTFPTYPPQSEVCRLYMACGYCAVCRPPPLPSPRRPPPTLAETAAGFQVALLGCLVTAAGIYGLAAYSSVLASPVVRAILALVLAVPAFGCILLFAFVLHVVLPLLAFIPSSCWICAFVVLVVVTLLRARRA